MPSKKKNRGSPVVTLRIPADLLAVIDAQIEKCNRTRREEEYTRSSFILAALAERFDKYARAKKAARRKKAPTAAELQQAAADVAGPDNPTARLAQLDCLIDAYMAGEPLPSFQAAEERSPSEL